MHLCNDIFVQTTDDKNFCDPTRLWIGVKNPSWGSPKSPASASAVQPVREISHTPHHNTFVGSTLWNHVPQSRPVETVHHHSHKSKTEFFADNSKETIRKDKQCSCLLLCEKSAEIMHTLVNFVLAALQRMMMCKANRYVYYQEMKRNASNIWNTK